MLQFFNPSQHCKISLFSSKISQTIASTCSVSVLIYLNVFIVFNPVPFMGNGRNTLEFLAFDFQDGLEGLEANMSCDKKIIRVDL